MDSPQSNRKRRWRGLLALVLLTTLLGIYVPAKPVQAETTCSDLSWKMDVTGVWWDDWWKTYTRTTCKSYEWATVGDDFGLLVPILGLNPDYFDVKWTGKIRLYPNMDNTATKAKVHFLLRSDDYARAYVNGQTVVEDWSEHEARDKTADVWLPVGTHDLVMDYSEKTGFAVAKLSWSILRFQHPPRMEYQTSLEYREGQTVDFGGFDSDPEDSLTYTLVDGTLPPGVHFDSKLGVYGRIRYDANDLPYSKTFRFTLKASDGLDEAQQSYTMYVKNMPAEWQLNQTPDLMITKRGMNVNWPVPYSNPRNTNLTFEVKGLPPGLAFDPNTKTVVGKPTVNGEYKVKVLLSDGILEDTASFTWSVRDTHPDTTAPVIQASVNPVANAGGWVNKDVSISFTCSDPESGIQTCSSPVQITKEGRSQTITGSSMNGAGLTSAASVTVNLDKTAPTLSGKADRAPNRNGWYNGDVTIQWEAADSLSGISSPPQPSVLTREGENLTVASSVSDNAGNTAQAQVKGLRIDRTPPSTRYDITPVPSSNGKWIASLRVELLPSDSLSGLETTEYRINGREWKPYAGTFTVDAGDTLKVEYRSIDKAGNVERTQTMDFEAGECDCTRP